MTTLHLWAQPISRFPRKSGSSSLGAQIFASAVLGVLVACGTANAQTSDHAAGGVVRAGGDSSYPPFESLGSDGKPQGFNIALMQAICQEAGLTVEFELAPWPDIMDAFRQGRIDAVPMFISEERQTEFLFTDPFTIVYHKILVRKGEPAFRSLEEMAGHPVLVQQGAWAHDHLLRHVPGAQVIPVASEPEAIRLLAGGQGEAAFVTRIGARMAIRSGEAAGIRVSSPPLAPCEYAFAVRADRPDLFRMIDAGLETLVANGRFEDLHNRWFGDLIPRQFSLKEAIRKAAWILGPLLVLAVVGVAFSWMLRRKVAGQTADLTTSNRMLRMLSDCNQALIRLTEESELLDTICRVLVQEGEYPFAWVGRAEDDDAKTVRPTGQYGCDEDCLDALRVTWADEPHGRGPVGRAIRTGEPAMVDDIEAAADAIPWREAAVRRGARSILALPIIAQGRTYGAIAICASRPHAFANPDEMALLRELADDLAFGVNVLQVRAEKDRVAMALEESETRLRMLVEHGQDIVCATDVAGTITYVSPSIRRYGYSPEQMVSQSFLSFIAEQDRNDIAARFAEAVETGEERPSEFRMRAKDGSEPWIEARGTVTRDDGGAIIGMVVVGRDISERRLAETTLQHRMAMQKVQALLSLHSLQSVGKDMDCAINDALLQIGLLLEADRSYLFRFDTECRMMSNTHEWCASGVEPQQANLQDIPVDSAPWWMAHLRRFESMNIASVADLPAEASKEKEILQAQSVRSLFVAPVFWQQNLLGFMGLDFVRGRRVLIEADRSELETMANTLGLLLAHQSGEQSLRDQEELYHTLVEDMPGLICRFKADGTLTFVNDEYCRYFERRREDLIGQSFIPLVPEGDQQRVREAFRSCGPDNPTVEYQHRVILPDGRIRWIRWIDRALFNANGSNAEYQSIGVDITDQLVLQEQMEHSQKMETIGMLAGGVAHDFNNGLQAILGFAELALLETPPPDPRADDVKEIISAAEHAKRLTGQLLAFSRRIPLELTILDLNDQVEKQQKMLGRLLGEDVQVGISLGENVPRIVADAGQMEQVLLNLAVNARDAMPDGGRLTISTSSVEFTDPDVQPHPGAKPGEYACLTVSDTGCGIPQDVLQKIFDPFFTTKAKGKGTGLGLSTIYGIVRQQEGWIHVCSKEGQGSTFKIYFPAAEEDVVTSQVTGAPAKDQGSTIETARILVVEDEEAIGRIAGRILSSRGYAADVVTSISEARAALSTTPSAYDLIFSDVVLGDGNGVELAEWIAANDPRRRILFASGYADERSRWASIQEHGWKCLMKPYSAKALLSAVEEVLSGHTEGTKGS